MRYLFYRLFCLTGVFSLVFMFHSCEQPGNDSQNAALLVGDWRVEENSQFFKSLNSAYQVSISLDGQDSSQIVISNFYHLGTDIFVRGKVSGKRIELLSNQQLSSFGESYTVVSGTGIITDDFQNIDWEYQVDDGSGEIDHVTAIYFRN